MDGWQIVWQALFNSFVEKKPDVREPLKQEQQLKLFNCALCKNLQYQQNKPFTKIK